MRVTKLYVLPDFSFLWRLPISQKALLPLSHVQLSVVAAIAFCPSGPPKKIIKEHWVRRFVEWKGGSWLHVYCEKLVECGSLCDKLKKNNVKLNNDGLRNIVCSSEVHLYLFEWIQLACFFRWGWQYRNTETREKTNINNCPYTYLSFSPPLHFSSFPFFNY